MQVYHRRFQKYQVAIKFVIKVSLEHLPIRYKTEYKRINEYATVTWDQ